MWLRQADGETPLLSACRSGHEACVRTLVGRGAAINQAKVGCASPGSSPDGEQHDPQLQRRFNRGGEVRRDGMVSGVWARALLQTGGSWTPLHAASHKGHVECVRALLDGGAAINKAEVGCASSMACLCGC
jgi:ankyrin repeat protein